MTHPLLIPMTAHVAHVALLYALLTIARAPAIWGVGRRADGSNAFASLEPRLGANLSNQFEWPLVFQLACVLHLVSGSAGAAAVAVAWTFVAGRLLHSAVQIGTRDVRLRGLVFMVNFGAALVLWGLLFVPRFGG